MKESTITLENNHYWNPTLFLRWRETNQYNPVLDEFEKVLEQKWISTNGSEEWREIEIVVPNS